ncbi:MAG: acetyl-CoA carboxylase biotin carboxyl carrier protein, partial [Burkholderiales bacterium]|nr:acetyl-CoA carboxylase biotin carboxyl carrier protein [Burkholderiales bacterium]
VKAGAAPVAAYAPAPAAAAAPVAMPPAPALPTAPAAPPAPAGRVIKAPMVGTFYRSSSPGAKAFVEIGDTIAEGQAVCIIEAMKIMNEIEADCAGKVLSILCENGQAVEFGQPLFMVE